MRSPNRRFWRWAILASGVAAVWIGALYLRDLERAHARIRTGSQVVATACGPIEYAASGEGPAVLIVHGAGGGFDQGRAFGESLALRGFRVIALSRFGYLRTPLPADASAQAQADAHACLLEALKLPRAAVIGISAGAPSSVQFALRHADRTSALVLLVPALYAPRPGNLPALQTPEATPPLFDTALRWDFLFWTASRLARDTMTRAILATPPPVLAAAAPDEQRRAAQVLDSILPISRRRAGLLNDAAVTSSLPRYELERIAAPTLAVSAADDLFGTFDAARYSAWHIPGARFVGLPDGGHLWIGHQDRVAEEISQFLAKTR